ncbi:hypothetical protein EG68_10060 [Paragonimus skrjabini miyazakii]|uniref:Secreted protein n=1 Tax=Paragonimus skrjabini miyazakii TaxID=59628 RepID=A0A8S9YGK8_9TREM|nr:hypothetical protein EG68_10060 [Paragonimus skrjabini miyazakii]
MPCNTIVCFVISVLALNSSGQVDSGLACVDVKCHRSDVAVISHGHVDSGTVCTKFSLTDVGLIWVIFHSSLFKSERVSKAVTLHRKFKI